MEEATCFRELPGPATPIGGGALIEVSWVIWNCLPLPWGSTPFPQQRALPCSSEMQPPAFVQTDCQSSVGVRQTCM